MQSLPQELYDRIYALIFSADAIDAAAPSYKYITKDYKPPFMLHINRRIRENFAKQFYGRPSVFYCSKQDAIKWLASLPRLHIEMIEQIRILNFFVGDTTGILSEGGWYTGRIDLSWHVVTELRNAIGNVQNPMWFIDTVFEFEVVNAREEGDQWVPAWRCRLMGRRDWF